MGLVWLGLVRLLLVLRRWFLVQAWTMNSL